jgi:hypothetical protein
MDSGGARAAADPLDMPSFNSRGARAAGRVEPDGRPGRRPRRVACRPLDSLAGRRRRRRRGDRAGARRTADQGQHYTLSQPGRIVIDVFGDSQKRAKVEFLKVIDPLVRRARVAHHDGRMRIVLDLTTVVPPAYALDTRGGTLTLTLGAARPEAAAAPEQPEH